MEERDVGVYIVASYVTFSMVQLAENKVTLTTRS